MLKRHRKEGIYTIESDQTHRDDLYGEIPETVLEYVDGGLRLGETRSQLARKERLSKEDEANSKVLGFIQQHPGCNTTDIVNGLKMAKKTVLKSLDGSSALIRRTGDGEKGSPYAYSVEIFEDKSTEVINAHVI